MRTRTDFYPRPPRGGRHDWLVVLIDLDISIHALREEGDTAWSRLQDFGVISIHALREEGDIVRFGFTPKRFDFYPRPPRGGRRGKPWWKFPSIVFLSTPSARRATSSTSKTSSTVMISIHALREEGDQPSW